MKVYKFVVRNAESEKEFAVINSFTILDLVCSAMSAINIKSCEPFVFELNGVRFNWEDEKIINHLYELNLKVNDKLVVISDNFKFECIFKEMYNGDNNIFNYPILFTDEMVNEGINVFHIYYLNLMQNFNYLKSSTGMSFQRMKFIRNNKKRMINIS